MKTIKCWKRLSHDCGYQNDTSEQIVIVLQKEFSRNYNVRVLEPGHGGIHDHREHGGRRDHLVEPRGGASVRLFGRGGGGIDAVGDRPQALRRRTRDEHFRAGEMSDLRRAVRADRAGHDWHHRHRQR